MAPSKSDLQNRLKSLNAARWAEEQKKVGLVDAESYSRLIKQLLQDPQPSAPTPVRCPEETKSFYDLVVKVADVARCQSIAMQQGTFRSYLANFMLFSMCSCLPSTEDPNHDLPGLLSFCSEPRSALKDLIEGARKINGWLARLSKVDGWALSRATEMVMLLRLPPSSLRRFAGWEDSDFPMDVNSPDQGHAASYLRLTPEYTVPLFIHKLCQIYGFRHDYDDLCRHLGYGDVNCPPAAQDIYRIGVDGKQPFPPVFLPVVTPRDVGHCTEVFCGTKPRKRRRLNAKPTARPDDAREDTSIDDSQREQAATIRSSPAPSGDCKYLAMVLQEMRCPQLSEGTLSRGLDGKKIWSEDGRSKLVAIGEIGLNERVLAALQRASTLRSALQQCKDRGLLAYDEHGEGLTVIPRSGPLLICEPEIQLDALRLLCFLSPNTLAFDPEYVRASYAEGQADADRSGRRVFRELLPALLTWTSIAQRAGASEALLCTLIEAIMNGYRACPSRQCGDLTDIVARLGNPALPAHLRLTLAWTQSYLHREKCQYEESDRVSQAAINAYAATDVRTACGRGHLYLSKAENAILRNDLEGARRCADMFDLPTELTSQSDMTWHMARLKWTVNARICRFSGQFEEAKRYLEICLKYCRNRDSTKAPYVLRLLADVHCELKCPETAEQLLKAPLKEHPPRDGRMSTTCRRLTTSLAHSIARQGRFGEALTYVQDVEAHYDQQQASNPTNELEHFYTKTMHMIIAFHMANFDESLRAAGQALDLAERYRSFRPNNFYRGFVLRYRAMIRLQQANQDVTEAANCVAQPRHYLAGMGTYELEKMDREEKAQLALLKGAYAKVHDP